MNLWITGSSGFIGSHLKKRFPKRNTICIPHKTLEDVEELQKLVYETQPTAIYHFAAYGNMAHQQDEHQMILSNILYLWNLLTVTKNIDYKIFVNCSTSSVYGDKDHPMRENNSLDGKDFYSITKQCGELLVRAFVNKYDKPIVSIRPFSVYGKGEADFRFIPTIIRCIKHGLKMKLAPGMHDWIWAEDLIDAIFAIQEGINDVKGLAVNIGTGTQYDNYDVVKHLAMLAKVDMNKLNIEHVPSLRSKDSWVADNSLLHRLGWQQQTSLIDGLKKVWEQ